jgi:hypothetical protein
MGVGWRTEPNRPMTNGNKEGKNIGGEGIQYISASGKRPHPTKAASQPT